MSFRCTLGEVSLELTLYNTPAIIFLIKKTELKYIAMAEGGEEREILSWTIQMIKQTLMEPSISPHQCFERQGHGDAGYVQNHSSENSFE